MPLWDVSWTIIADVEGAALVAFVGAVVVQLYLNVGLLQETFFWKAELHVLDG